MRLCLAWSLSLLAMGMAVLALGSLRVTGASSGAIAPPCQFRPGRAITPAVVSQSEQVTLTLSLAAQCDPNDRPLHLVLVVDSSAENMGREALGQLSAALRQAVTDLDMGRLPYLRLGVVAVADDQAQVKSFLTDDPSRVLNAIPTKGDASGKSCIPCGLADALRVLRNGRAGRSADELREAILLATGGLDSYGCDALRTSAGELKAYGALVVIACVGRGCEQRCLSEAASDERFAFRRWDWNFIRQRVKDLVHSSGPSFQPVDSVRIQDWLSDSLMYTGGGYPSQAVGNHLTWQFPWPTEGVTITYHARAESCGRFRASRQTPQAQVYYNRTFWARVTPPPVAFPNPLLVVPCPTSTPTMGASPTPTPTAGSTRTLTPPPEVTLTPPPSTGTPPGPTASRPTPQLYLPQVVAGACAGEWPAVDVVLAIDVSGSMELPARAGGQSRREVAHRVARAMIGRLKPGRDQVAVVVYGDEELLQVLAPLAPCCPAARRAVELLPRYNGSRLDLAIDAAVGQLTGQAARAGVPKVLVIITDGDLNQTPPDRLAGRAAAARRAGILIRVIAVGDAADVTSLSAVAGTVRGVYLTRNLPAGAVDLLAPLPRCWR